MPITWTDSNYPDQLFSRKGTGVETETPTSTWHGIATLSGPNPNYLYSQWFECDGYSRASIKLGGYVSSYITTGLDEFCKIAIYLQYDGDENSSSLPVYNSIIHTGTSFLKQIFQDVWYSVGYSDVFYNNIEIPLKPCRQFRIKICLYSENSVQWTVCFPEIYLSKAVSSPGSLSEVAQKLDDLSLPCLIYSVDITSATTIINLLNELCPKMMRPSRTHSLLFINKSSDALKIYLNNITNYTTIPGNQSFSLSPFNCRYVKFDSTGTINCSFIVTGS
jgi:hypothetical protein